MALPAPSADETPDRPHSPRGRRSGAGAGAVRVQSLTEACREPVAEPTSTRDSARDVLQRDRARAGERRAARAPVALATVDYRPSLSARWYAFRLAHWYWFHGEGASSLRRWGVRSGLALALSVGLACVAQLTGVAWPAAPVRAAGPETGSSSPLPPSVPPAQPSVRASVSAAATPSEPAPVEPGPERVSAEPDAAPASAAQEPAQDVKLAGMIEELSPWARVVRADALLRHPHVVAARRARGLLESALASGVGGAHAQAALAEACLRVEDVPCARIAAERAIQLRPWRGGYRTLRRRVQAAGAESP